MATKKTTKQSDPIVVARRIITLKLKEYFDFDQAVAYEKAIFLMAQNASGVDPTIRSESVNLDAYNRIAYEKVGEFAIEPDKVKRAINTVEMWDDSGESVWSSPAYEEHETRYYSALDRSQQKPKAVKGVHKCRARVQGSGARPGGLPIICGSDEFYMWSAQTRSSDEGMTHFRQCAKCGARGKE